MAPCWMQKILGDVFLLMTGVSLRCWMKGKRDGRINISTDVKRVSADRPALKIIRCNDEELTAHQQRLEEIEK